METTNKLMTLDGLIERLQDIRDAVGHDLPIIAGDTFDFEKNDSIITTVCLETKNSIAQVVSFIVEKPRYSFFKGIKTVDFI